MGEKGKGKESYINSLNLSRLSQEIMKSLLLEGKSLVKL